MSRLSPYRPCHMVYSCYSEIKSIFVHFHFIIHLTFHIELVHIVLHFLLAVRHLFFK